MGSQGISIGTSLVYSALGLSVVFSALVALALVIILFSKIVKKTGIETAEAGAKTQGTAGGAAAAEGNGEDLSLLAAIIAAVTEDARQHKESVVVTSIREIR
ncbi:MAG: OadG family protein [Fusobacteriaceae bacterium]|jgi:sodium pump decarboxylase gamma subunit|nr:OadG family protein [Fusobacteriaceae bacterium]